MGGDSTVVNAARVSFDSFILDNTTLSARDTRLIYYLAKNKHMSPFRHVVLTLLLEDVPEVVLRQLYKHQVGIAYTSSDFRECPITWNEVSGRYVEFDQKAFTPKEFRVQSSDNKQASLPDKLVEDNDYVTSVYSDSINYAYSSYKKLLESGVCREQARMLLPLAFETSVIWTASLEALVHFVKLRDHEHAQEEIRELARVIKEVLAIVAPVSVKALLGAETE